MSLRRFWTSIGTYVDYEPTGSRDFTDLASNAVFMPDIGSLRDPVALAQGRLPEKHLRLFLHEATHHVAFDSRVGNALGALWGVCAGMPVETLTSRDEPKLPARDVAIFRTAYPLLNPLLEGTALLSEFDAVPGEMPVVSRVAQYGILLFGKGRIQSTTDDPFREYGQWLHNSRKAEEWVNRKAALLRDGIESPQRYLLGYLGVKGMHRFLRSACPALADTEMFLLLLLDYWFGDARMAASLLEPHDRMNPWVSIGAQVKGLSDYFQDRMDELYKNANNYGRQCCLHFLAGGSGSESTGEPTYRNSKETSDFELEMHWGIRTAVTAINLVWPRVWKHRRVFRFSSARAKVEIQAGRKVNVTNLDDDDGGSISIPGVPNCTEGLFDGTIESVVMPDGRTPLVCVFAGDGLVGVLNPQTGIWNEPHHVQALDDCPSLLEVEGAMHAFGQRQMFSEESEVGKMIEFYSKQSEEATLDLWLQLAFHKADRAHRNQILDVLKSEGFGALLHSEEQMQDLARLSLACGGRKRPANDVAKEVNMTPSELRRRIDEFNSLAIKRLNWCLFSEDAAGLECLV